MQCLIYAFVQFYGQVFVLKILSSHSKFYSKTEAEVQNTSKQNREVQ